MLLLCLFLSSVFFALFGFSTNMTTALTSNFALGATNGGAGIVTTSFAEVCGNEHQARGTNRSLCRNSCATFAFELLHGLTAIVKMNAGWGILGTSNAILRLAAPPLGGYLGSQHVIAAYPFALPSIVFATFGFVVLLVISIFPSLLPETLKSANREDVEEASQLLKEPASKIDGNCVQVLRNQSCSGLTEKGIFLNLPRVYRF